MSIAAQKSVETIPAGFRKIERAGKPALFVLNDRANCGMSRIILKNHGLRPLTDQEALASAEDLIKEFGSSRNGRSFWLAGEGLQLQESGHYNFDTQGQRHSPADGPVNQQVRVFSGDQPLLLEIYSDDDAKKYGWRFDLKANTLPSANASLVIGIALAESGNEVVSPQDGSGTKLLRQTD